MKALNITLALLLSSVLVGCGGGSGGAHVAYPVAPPVVEAEKGVYIVAGQSNAAGCDWSYFEDLTGYKTINIAISGAGINTLINRYDRNILGDKSYDGIIFIHGETDAIEGMDSLNYIKQVEVYRSMISDGSLPLYISSVGHSTVHDDDNFNMIRDAVESAATYNPLWDVSYTDAKYYIDWNMLIDSIHYSKEGCELMMLAFSHSI